MVKAVIGLVLFEVLLLANMPFTMIDILLTVKNLRKDTLIEMMMKFAKSLTMNLV